MTQRRVKGLAIHRPIVYGNTSVFVLPSERQNLDHSHRWTIAVRSAASPLPGKRGEVQQIGGADDISHFIKKVTFKLHDTYPNSLRVIERPPFEVTETGWGEFEIQIKIFFIQEANEKIITVQHLLKLHPWAIQDGIVVPAESVPGAPGSGSGDLNPAVHSWQYDEIVFNDPTEALYNILIQFPPTKLPSSPRSTHALFAPISQHNGGAFGELTLATATKEGEKIDAAKQSIATELQQWRDKLVGYENEIKALKQDIEGM